MKVLFRSLLLIGLIALFYFLMPAPKQANSFLFYNANLVTMESQGASSEKALLVEDGKIISIGDYEVLQKQKQAGTEEVDLKGKTLLPGFIDSHTHPVLTGFTYNMLDLSGFSHNSNIEVWQALQEEIKQRPAGEWIICKGLDPILVKDLKTPNIQFLDHLSKEHPILVLAQSLHSYWANSLAFELVGIDKNTPNPSESSYYERDSSGNLTGFIAEQLAFMPFRDVILEALGKDAIIQASVDALKSYLAKGNTTVSSLGLTTDDPNVLLLYKHLSAAETSLLNKALATFGILPKRSPMPRNFVFVREDAHQLLPASIDNGDDFYKIVGVKLWYDGSPYTGSMYMEEAYIESDLTQKGFRIPPHYHGEALLDKKDLAEKLEKYQEQGWQIAIHTQGDLAIQEVLEIYKSLGNTAVKDHRHRLEHCLLLDTLSIENMEQLGIAPSFHINHLWYYGRALNNEIIGAERGQQILPIKQAIKHDLISTLHADRPMFESGPMDLLHTAVNRQTKEGDTLGISQAISVMEGLEALTINAAWQIKMEDKLGSLKVGKYADLVVLDKNPLQVPKAELRNIKVERTYVNGQLVYKR